MTPDDERKVLENLNSPTVRDSWGITGAGRAARIAFAVQGIALLAVAGGLVYYLLGDFANHGEGLYGMVVVTVLVFAAAAVRLLQVRTASKDMAGFQPYLRGALTGEDAHDMQAQTQAEDAFEWGFKTYKYIAMMVGLAAFIILTLNTYRVGGMDVARTIIFDCGIVSFLAGMFWANYAIKEGLLIVELEERLRATIPYRRLHPEVEEEDDEEPEPVEGVEPWDDEDAEGAAGDASDVKIIELEPVDVETVEVEPVAPEEDEEEPRQ